MAAMDDVPNELLKAAYQRKPIYILKVPLLYGMWAATVAALWALWKAQGPSALFFVAGVAGAVLIANCIRGLGAVAHDAVHGNCSRSKRASYWISLLCWAPTGMSVTLYTNYHLHHHRIANTYPDVDNFVVTNYTRHPVLAKVLLLAVYTFFYPIYWLTQMFRFYMKRLTPMQRVLMNVEAIGWWSLVALAGWWMPGWVFAFAFALPFVFGSFLASVTSMIEHYEMLPGDDDSYSSRTYSTKSHITNFIWNNVSYHNEHHKYPGIPWYNLRSFHEAAYPYYDDKVKAEVYPTMWGVAFKLWGRILAFDLAEHDARYKATDKVVEEGTLMVAPGIPVQTPERLVVDGQAARAA